MSIGSADGLENSSSRDSEPTLLSSSGYFCYFQKNMRDTGTGVFKVHKLSLTNFFFKIFFIGFFILNCLN